MQLCCGGGRCNRIFITDRNTYIIQGKMVEEEVKNRLNLLPNESAVEIPKELMEEFIQKFSKKE